MIGELYLRPGAAVTRANEAYARAALPPLPRAGVGRGEGDVAEHARRKVAINPRELDACEAPLAASKPTWWRLTLTLHQGVTVIRYVIVKPSAKVILSTGWFEVAANGDEFAVGYDAIATVSINGFSGPMPGGTL